MRAVFLLFVLFVLALVCVAARSDDADTPIRTRVLCDGSRVAAIQVAVREPGVYTLLVPAGICGRSA